MRCFNTTSLVITTSTQESGYQEVPMHEKSCHNTVIMWRLGQEEEPVNERNNSYGYSAW